ncbi:MAG: hypothetical protein VB050_11145 [Geobacteraceae bacterium]|nr:hypothetical protein [Geobacteraceae bacterium]
MTKTDKKDFKITSDEDEIRVDGLCRNILRDFHRSLLDRGTPPHEAGSLAHGADYFLRDYVVSARRENILDETPGLIRRFAATWYIISTLEPSLDELAGYLKGVRAFYYFLHDKGMISPPWLSRAVQECSDLDYYGKRIESFWNIKDDGYVAWEAECTLKRNH